MNPTERNLVEAIKSMFENDPAVLGIIKSKPEEEYVHTSQFQREHIHDLFALKISDSLFYESLKSAFYNIHSYKYLDDPSFGIAFKKRLSATGIPKEEIEKGLNAIETVIKEMKGSNDSWSEKSAGWNPHLKEIQQVSQEFNRKPERKETFSGGGPYPNETE